MGDAGTALLRQAFPRSGTLAENTNVRLPDLRERLAPFGGDGAYCYIVASVYTETGGGRFVQTGSGPNFQGDLVTLCTCKHQMRAGRDADAWRGLWIAGYTSRARVGDGRNYLVYLMRVRQAFISQSDLWRWLPEGARQSKAAEEHVLGDVYRPAPVQDDPYDPDAYASPRPDHVHAAWGQWRKDIDYRRWGRRPALLVGDPSYSFLWDGPHIPAPFRLGRGVRKSGLATLLGAAQDGAP